nr:hypothetical protein [Armatimonas sp.]
MIKLPTGLFVDALGYSKAERLGTVIIAGDKALLLAELSSAGLSSATIAEKLDYLNTPKVYDNGPAPLIQVATVGYDALQRWVGSTLSRILATAPQLASKWALLSAAFLQAQPQADLVNSNSERLAGIAALLQADGIAPDVEELFSVPDPAWVASEWLTPANHTLSQRVIVQAADLV